MAHTLYDIVLSISSFMRILSLSIGLLCCLFTAKAARDTVRLTDFIDIYEDFSLSTYKALEACKKYDAPLLLLPSGIHDYYPEQSFQQYIKMSNNINGQKRIAFPIIDQHNLIIEGQGAMIRLHGVMMGAILHLSSEIEIRNLSFDWATPFYLQGRVISVDTTAKTYRLRLLKSEKWAIQNNDLVIQRPESNYFIGGNYWFDPVSGAPVYKLERYKNRYWNPYKGKHYELKALDAQTIQVKNTIDSLPKVGWHFIAKWRNYPNVNRIAPTIHLQQSKDVVLRKVNVHSSAGMGIIGEKCENVLLEKVNVIPTPNTERVISTNADATHFVNCKGLVHLENCAFEASMDDGLNIHGNYATIRKKLSDHLLLAEIVHIQQEGFVFADASDQLRIIDPNTLLPTHDPLTVTKTEQLNDSHFLIYTEEELPALENGFGLDNISWTADLIMRNCTIQKNWARGALFKTGGKVLIEDNQISSSMSGLRTWGEMNFFNESGAVTDVIIRNNTFTNVCRVGNGQPAIVIFPQIKAEESIRKDGYYNENIQIIGNTFRTFDRAILFSQSVDGLTFSDNTIVETEDFAPIFPEKPTLYIKGCQHVEVKNNRYTGREEANIEITNCKVVLVEENVGFGEF
ncbi:MAG: right-handed parallel beta-helix repeat-containing protein [Bacteroidota bacterium]